MFVLAKCHAGSKQMCGASVVSFYFESQRDDMHVGFQFESFVYIKPNGGTRPVRFQSAPGLQGDAGGAAIPAPVPAPASLESRRRRRDYIMTMTRFTIYVMLLGVKVVNSCRQTQSCAMRCSPSAGTGVLAGVKSC